MTTRGDGAPRVSERLATKRRRVSAQAHEGTTAKGTAAATERAAATAVVKRAHVDRSDDTLLCTNETLTPLCGASGGDTQLDITPDIVTAFSLASGGVDTVEFRARVAIGDIDGDSGGTHQRLGTVSTQKLEEEEIWSAAPLRMTTEIQPLRPAALGDWFGDVRMGVPKMTACDTACSHEIIDAQAETTWLAWLRHIPKCGSDVACAWMSGKLLEMVGRRMESCVVRGGVSKWRGLLPFEAWSPETLHLLVADVMSVFRAVTLCGDVSLFDDLPHPDMLSSVLHGRQVTMAACLYLVTNEWSEGILSVAACLALCEPETDTWFADDMRVWAQCSTFDTATAGRLTGDSTPPSAYRKARAAFLGRVVQTMSALTMAEGRVTASAELSRGRLLPHLVSQHVMSLVTRFQDRDGGAFLSTALRRITQVCLTPTAAAMTATTAPYRRKIAAATHQQLTEDTAAGAARNVAMSWVRDLVLRGRLPTWGHAENCAATRCVVMGELRRLSEAGGNERAHLDSLLQELVEALLAYFVWSITRFGIGDGDPRDDARGVVRVGDALRAACVLVDVLLEDAEMMPLTQCGLHGPSHSTPRTKRRAKNVACDLALRHVITRRMDSGNVDANEARVIASLFSDGTDAFTQARLWCGLDTLFRNAHERGRIALTAPPMRWRRGTVFRFGSA